MTERIKLIIKKSIKYTLVLIVILLVLDSVVGFLSYYTGIKSFTMRMNDRAAQRVVDYITAIPAPAGCDIVDTIALSGNIDSVGKVTYYYGAVLVRSDIPEEDLAEYYRQFEYNEKCIDVEKQESQKPEGIRAASALDRDYFLTDVSDGNYYTLSGFGKSIGFFGLLYDPRSWIG